MIKDTSWKRIARAMTFARPYTASIIGILLMTLTVSGIGAVEPLVMKFIFDQLSGAGTWNLVLLGIGLLLAVNLFREGFGGFSNWLSWRTRLSLQANLMDTTVGRLHRLPLQYHRKEGVGGVMTRLDRGVQGFVQAVSEIAFNILPSVTYLVMAAVVMLRLDWRLSLLVFLFSPLPALIAAVAAPVQVRRERSLLNRWAKLYSRFHEVLSGIVTVRSFAMEDEEKQRFVNGFRRANGLVLKGVRFDTFIGVVQNTSVTLARISSIALGSYLIFRGESTLGTLVAFLSYAGGLFAPVQGLTGVYRTLKTASVSLDQIFSILDAQDCLGDSRGARNAHELSGDIRFQNVSFSYESGKNNLLSDIDFHIKPGEMIAFVGPSGAGKTTIMSLLQRFYDPDEGAIQLDGVDVRSFRQQSLRKQIGVVLQDAHLFNDTIRNNIAYGRPGASIDEIVEAAKAANAHDFIMRLPKGYDTRVGERGGSLSAGERQRIAIARALVKNPPILILDEATSALDAELEAQVQEALERLVQGRTTLAIAHRLATVVNADRIFVLKNGGILEAGSHRDLIRQNGYYASLVHKQTHGLLCA